MKKLWMIPAAAAASAAAACGTAYAIFRYAFSRGREGSELNDIHYKPLEPWREEIDASIQWFLDQKPEEVFLRTDDGLKLHGWYLAHPNPRGAIVLVHGYRGSWSTEFSCVYPYYYELGFSILTYWQRTHGTSEGDTVCFGLKERYDCLRWIEYLNTRIPAGLPILLDGISMGASTVMMAAGLNLPENVRGIIADSGFACPWDEIGYVLRHAHVPVRPLLDALNLQFRRKTGMDLRSCDTRMLLPQVKIPMVFIHGEADTLVPSRFSVENYEACGSAYKKLILVPGAEHGMSYLTDRERLRKEIEAFFDLCTSAKAEQENL